MARKARWQRWAIGAVAAAWLAAGAGAFAQNRGPQTPGNQPVQFYADEITYDSELGTVVASGNVEVTQAGRVLRADRVTFNERANLVAANGRVRMLEPTGEVLSGDYVELTGDLREGVIQDFRMMLVDQSRFAATYGRRIEGNRTILTRAVYSPCELCKEDPRRAPLWQVKARRIEHDQTAKDIVYRDAWLEIAGVPVVYTPYLSHPDPTVKRRSGLLAPEVGSTDSLGAIASLPYYFVLSPSSDLTLEPIVTTKGGIVAAGEYRQRFHSGFLEFSASAVSAPRVDENDDRIDGRDFRGHIKGTGRFDIDDEWRTGFDLARSTDDTYLSRYRLLRRYGFPSSTTLTSRGFAEGFFDRSYFGANTYAFQGLRSTDDPGQAPLVMPMFDYSYLSPPGTFLGGHVGVDANALSIFRTDGTDTRRLAVRTGWTRPYIAPAGDIYTFQASVQTALYDVSAGEPDGSGFNASSGTYSRVSPTIGMSWRYPLVRNGGEFQQFIEPMAAVAISPNARNDDKLPNEDSRSFDLDYTNLFSTNRFGGIDRVEQGQRFIYGMNTGINDYKGRSARLFLGQSLQWNTDDDVLPGSGLANRTSDVVGRLTLAPHRYASLNYQFRAERNDLTMVRNLATFSVGPPALRVDGFYLFTDRNAQPQTYTTDVEQVGARITTRITENWSFQAENLRALGEDSGDLRWAANLIYSDECIVAGVFFVRRLIGDRDNPPDSAVLFRVVFRNLGEIAPRLF